MFQCSILFATFQSSITVQNILVHCLFSIVHLKLGQRTNGNSYCSSRSCESRSHICFLKIHVTISCAVWCNMQNGSHCVQILNNVYIAIYKFPFFPSMFSGQYVYIMFSKLYCNTPSGELSQQTAYFGHYLGRTPHSQCICHVAIGSKKGVFAYLIKMQNRARKSYKMSRLYINSNQSHCCCQLLNCCEEKVLLYSDY